MSDPKDLFVFGKTISGREIILERPDEQNWARQKVSLVQSWIQTEFEQDEFPMDILGVTLEIFRHEAMNDRHFGDNKPGLFSSAGVPLLPNPQFNYWDFFGFAISGYRNGFAGFAKDLKLHSKVTYRATAGAIGLLLLGLRLGNFNSTH